MKWLLLDNYDSFTFNLYQLIAEMSGREPIVAKNDRLSWNEFRALDVDAVVISPGPGHPDRERDFGICRRVIEQAELPILGICLGHQGIASVFGGHVVKAPEPVHGRVFAVHHTGIDIFESLPQDFGAVRYHSLMVSRPVPELLEELAWTQDGVLMGLRHRTRPIWGLQCHPESICTEYGRAVLENFQRLAERYRPKRNARTNGLYERSSPPTLSPTPPPSRSSPSSPLSSPSSSSPTPAEKSSEWRAWVRRLDSWPEPEAAFRNLYRNDASAFWLDSSYTEGGLGRFSFMGDSDGPNAAIVRYSVRSGRLSVQTHDRTVDSYEPLFPFLKSWLAERSCSAPDAPFDFNGGFVGYFGYELKAECGASARHEFEAPDCTLIFADRLIAFDHLERTAYLVCTGPRHEEANAERWFQNMQRMLARLPADDEAHHPMAHEIVIFRPELSRQRYLQSIARCQQFIREGESYEICLTTQLKATTATDPYHYYTTLRNLNPAPYAAFLRLPDLSIAGSSPECFLKIRPNGTVESKPIKGTSRRGAAQLEDEQLREKLRTDAKTRSENLMIVDLIRNDLGTVCSVGSVHVPKLMNVESYATVHQLVSTIVGRLKEGVTAIDCLQRAFPGGSMTGAPKLRTMELIDELEPGPRGVYSGTLGYLALNGAADLSIVIRTAVFREDTVSIGTGGAVVALSEDIAEFDEMLLKSRALVNAFRVVAGDACLQTDHGLPLASPVLRVDKEKSRSLPASRPMPLTGQSVHAEVKDV